jgi:hypothetical protein
MAKIKVDFSGVEESKDFDIAPGKYRVKVQEITQETGAKAPYLKWKLKILNGSAKGLTIFHNTSLAPNALFSLRDTLVALGVSVPKSAVAIDPDKFIGKEFGIETTMRTYEGKEYANVKKVFNIADDTDEDDVPFDMDSEVSIDLE